MAVAYVKILEGSKIGRKRIIPLSEIKPPLEGLKFNPQKKYRWDETFVKILDAAGKFFIPIVVF